jgi:hypothetical protein
LILSEFKKYDADYEAKHELYGEKLEELAKLMASAQTGSKSLPCTYQLFLEAKWLYHNTAHWKRLDDQLERAKASLGQKDQDLASEQRPTDGFWGICLTSHFMRISVTLDAMEDLTRRGQQPRYSIRSAGAMDTDKKLLTRMQDLLLSDIARTGVNNRGELSSLITSISQAAFKPYLRQIFTEAVQLPDSVSVDNLAKAFEFFLNGAQNTVTGYWGAWYIDISNLANARDFEDLQKAARPLAIEVLRLDLRNPPDLGHAFEEERVDAIRVNVDSVTRSNQRLIADLAAKHKLPAIYATREFADKGGLMSYGISYPDLYFRAASFVNKIFNGAKPGDLPVEEPTKLELIINMKTAKEFGLTIPPSIRADEVIE